MRHNRVSYSFTNRAIAMTGIWLERVMMNASNSNVKPLSRLPQGTETALTPHRAQSIRGVLACR